MESNTNKILFTLKLYIYPITDCSEDLKSRDPLEVEVESNDDLYLKSIINDCIIQTMKAFKANEGKTYIEMNIFKNGRYYDSDDGYVMVDYKTNSCNQIKD